MSRVAAPASTACDLAVVGGGPAGCAAAIAGVRAGLSVVLVERRVALESAGCPGWAGQPTLLLLGELGIDPRKLGPAFTGVRLWDWDLKRSVVVVDPDLCGALLDSATLGATLMAAARASGAVVHQPESATVLSTGEDGVRLHLASGNTLHCRVLLLAGGAHSRLTEHAGLVASPRANGVSAALADGKVEGAADGLDIVLGSGRHLRLATMTRRAGQVRVALATRDNATGSTAQLQDLITNAGSRKLFPPQTTLDCAEIPCVAGAALDYEMHVGKRCLLIGDAGGFVGAFSQDGLYPALRSGCIAAGAAAAALRARLVQDELARFEALWRAELADYLRMPNTDLGLLLPMVLNNEQMSRRLARAFILGQPF